jgi:NAD+ synthase (glutamine-hydrolysing)
MLTRSGAIVLEASQGKADLIFENVQARARTNLLMNSGFVIGTGDMSELALGWCTYNGDHMSMYNVNCSVPKTLVRFLVSYIANNLKEFNANQILTAADPEKLKQVLVDIVATPISPELLPTGKDKDSTHRTESVIGPYELHDFFLFHRIRNGFTRAKILFLAENSMLINKYTEDEIKKWYDIFIQRFFSQQFKRNCVPDGPKVGSISLSPRGDWRMPSDAEIT